MTEPNKLQDNNRPLEISLEPFYTDILSKKFTTSVEAIDYCRKLCAHFGFTIKQEQSTYRNIYVYCSREGFPDSLRNPKSNPKRRRPSKRCDCRWRIVLNEQNESWHFRKSLNPDASKHNHDLMRPEEIDKGWPKEMLDLICELARQRLPTPDIRTRVQLLYAHVPWNERRFYNRLSEERQKQRIRDASHRVQQLCGIWSNLVTAAAASQELTDLAQIDLRRIVDKLCGMTQTDSSTFPLSQASQQQSQQQEGGDGDDDNDDDTNHDDSADDHYDPVQPASTSQDLMDITGDSSQDESTKPSSLNSRKPGSKAATHPDTPKGYTAVTVPQQIYYVKLHPHRVLQDVQQLHRRRSRSLAFSDEFNNDIGPAGEDSSFNNQLKKQKTPMLMEMAQQQHTQPLPPPPPDIQSTFSARQFETQHQHHFQQHPPPSNLPVNDPSPSSGFMYHRDAGCYSSTSYPVYQQQPLMPPPSRYIVDTNNNRQQHHQAMSIYTTGRPPLLTVTPDFQQHQQNMASSVPMTPPSSSSPSPHPSRIVPPPPPGAALGTQANISMLSTDTASTSPKDALLPVINQDPSSASTPTPQQPLTRPPVPPPPAQHQQPTYVLDHHGQQQFTSFYRPPPPPPTYPSLQQQQQDEHHQRIYYSNLHNHLLPIGNNNSNNNNNSNDTSASSQPPHGMYYMKQQPHLPPSQ
ncbi:hypothetical protein BCR42DRAFT_452079 [Absidia repens]|uniref:FAR1 domain-containing protein n=1 Tax=Absidia repens TaxID=90262 RepID=A0A1X2IES8_9FUNG|nr:hypothetical protein BCR42DRAFT_452079 [Absidia repens]